MNVVIIQARVGSSRLPGKVLEDLVGRTVLDHVIQRTARIDGIDAVCCAIPAGERDDVLAEVAGRSGATVFRGSEQDVLARYLGAAREMSARVVMRVTSDCPFIDPGVSGLVLEEFFRRELDYCSNLEPRAWPKGLDTEVFSMALLERAAAMARKPAEREHVTPYMRHNDDVRRGAAANTDGDFSAWRWTLDYPEDLAFFRAVLQHSQNDTPTFEEVRRIVEQWPEIAKINSHMT